MAVWPTPERNAIDDEIDRVLAENPGLLQELQDFDRRFAAGEVTEAEFVSHAEARRRRAMDS